MSKISDIKIALDKVGLWGMLKRIWKEIGDDDLFTRASALAYSWLFALFPFLLFLLSMIPFLPETWKQSAKHETAVFLYNNLPMEAANPIWENLWPRIDRLLQTPIKGLIGIGIILTLWGASGGINATMAALDRCYDVQKSRPIYKQRPLALGLTVCVALLVILVLVLIPIGTLVTAWVTAKGDFVIAKLGIDGKTGVMMLVLWQITRYFLALLLLFAILSILYHFGPNIRRRFRFITPGAIFCVLGWLGLGYVFNLYVTKLGGSGSYTETYGSVAGVAILLLIFYLDALILLIGAEINAEIDAVVHGASIGLIEAGQAVDRAPDPTDPIQRTDDQSTPRASGVS